MANRLRREKSKNIEHQNDHQRTQKINHKKASLHNQGHRNRETVVIDRTDQILRSQAKRSTYVEKAVDVFVGLVGGSHEEPSPVGHALLRKGHVCFSELAVVICEHWKLCRRQGRAGQDGEIECE
jgi:hypothetical protein